MKGGRYQDIDSCILLIAKLFIIKPHSLLFPQGYKYLPQPPDPVQYVPGGHSRQVTGVPALANTNQPLHRAVRKRRSRTGLVSFEDGLFSLIASLFRVQTY